MDPSPDPVTTIRAELAAPDSRTDELQRRRGALSRQFAGC